MRHSFARWLVLALVVATLSCSSEGDTYKLTPTPDPEGPFGVYVPKDLDDVCAELGRMLPSKLVRKIRTGTEEDMTQYHLNLGLWMRNNWGLWKGSRLSEYFNRQGIVHPDDMSAIILCSFWRHLNSKPVDLEGQVFIYKTYWDLMRGSRDPAREI